MCDMDATNGVDGSLCQPASYSGNVTAKNEVFCQVNALSNSSGRKRLLWPPSAAQPAGLADPTAEAMTTMTVRESLM